MHTSFLKFDDLEEGSKASKWFRLGFETCQKKDGPDALLFAAWCFNKARALRPAIEPSAKILLQGMTALDADYIFQVAGHLEYGTGGFEQKVALGGACRLLAQFLVARAGSTKPNEAAPRKFLQAPSRSPKAVVEVIWRPATAQA